VQNVLANNQFLTCINPTDEHAQRKHIRRRCHRLHARGQVFGGQELNENTHGKYSIPNKYPENAYVKIGLKAGGQLLGPGKAGEHVLNVAVW
jgi:hypothetical protein